MKSFLTLITYCFFITSCDTNKIYFDLGRQSVISCNDKGIYRIYIKNDSTSEIYMLAWKESSQSAPKEINIIHVDNRYLITKGWQKSVIDANNFKLDSFSKYTVERAQGDAAAFKVNIETGFDTRVINAYPYSCE